MTNANKIGLVFGAVIGGWHVCWSLLVLLGWAQPVIDFIFWAHMINPIYVIKPFDPKAAAALIIFTSVVGYAFGFVGTIVWNKVRQR